MSLNDTLITKGSTEWWTREIANRKTGGTRKYAVFYINEEGQRDGMEVIEARTPIEAKLLYGRFFNYTGHLTAVLRLEMDS